MAEKPTGFKRIKNETPEIQRMFEFWYNNGDEPQSMSAVAKQFNRSRRTINNYMLSFDWEARAEERRAKVVGALKHKAEIGEINGLGTYRRIFKDLMDKAQKDIASGTLKIRSVKDLAMIAELELKILEHERDLENDNNMQEGKLGALVDVFRNMPRTADPRSGLTVEQVTTTTIQSTRKDVSPDVLEEEE